MKISTVECNEGIQPQINPLDMSGGPLIILEQMGSLEKANNEIILVENKDPIDDIATCQGAKEGSAIKSAPMEIYGISPQLNAELANINSFILLQDMQKEVQASLLEYIASK